METKQPESANYPSRAVSALPFIDAHEVEVAAAAAPVWEAITATVPRFFGGGGRFSSAVANLLGTADTVCDFPRTVVGFRVVALHSPDLLALQGQHRFSRYQLDFLTQPGNNGTTRLRAESRAEFPGAPGRMYRMLVIGSRMHVLVVKRVLSTIKQRAERPVLDTDPGHAGAR